ncbi:hypothetical protein BG004_000627 [Podila humilis]|nr:hypothetical protein BG004_000627 [Podila humilis]
MNNKLVAFRSHLSQEWPRAVVGFVSMERIYTLYVMMNMDVPFPEEMEDLPATEETLWVKEHFATMVHTIAFMIAAPICAVGLYAAIMKSVRASKANMFYSAFAMLLPVLLLLEGSDGGFPTKFGEKTDPSDPRTLPLWGCYYLFVGAYAWCSLVLMRDCRGQPRNALGFLVKYEAVKLSEEEPEVAKPESKSEK